MEPKQYKYKFSVVIPIYNCGEYVAEVIDSVTNQIIGLKNIQNSRHIQGV